MKDIYTTVKINDREFSIRKFDARTGLKIARLLFAKAAPLLPALQNDGDDGDVISYEMIGKILDAVSDEELDMLTNHCLKVCSERLPAGLQPVMDANGFYGVEDIEYNLPLTLKLIFEAVKWGAADFFGENGFSLSQLTN